MKHYQKIISSAIVFCLAAVAANAQLGVEAGYLNSRYVPFEDYSMGTYERMRNGFNLGATYDLRLYRGLSLRAGLIYSYATASESRYEHNGQGKDLTFDQRYNEHYLNVPFRVGYTFRISRNFRVAAFTGPTISIGLANSISQKISGTYVYMDDNYEDQTVYVNGNIGYDFYSGREHVSGDIPDKLYNSIINVHEKDKLYRVDFLYGLGVTMTLMRHYELTLGYDWGLMYRLQSSAGRYIRRDSFYINLGYRF